jgi:protein DPCD|eukprot:Stramenopile-MAST_4_protein_4073
MAFLAKGARDAPDASRMPEEALGSGTTTALVTKGRLRVKTLYSGGAVEAEKVEEYDVRTDALVLRKWRQHRGIQGFGPYTIEIGEDAPGPADKGGAAFRPSSVNPVFLPQDTKEAFQWRVRNIRDWGRDIFQLTLEDDAQQIVLRTTNKKYFKRFDIPALKRLGISLDKTDLSYYVENSTLIILYAKPMKVVFMEEQAREARKKAPKKDGAIDSSSCKQQ